MDLASKLFTGGGFRNINSSSSTNNAAGLVLPEAPLKSMMTEIDFEDGSNQIEDDNDEDGLLFFDTSYDKDEGEVPFLNLKFEDFYSKLHVSLRVQNRAF